jgi:fucose permease
MGLIAEASHGIALAYAVPLTSYIYISFYSFFGSKERGYSGANAGNGKVCRSHNQARRSDPL